VTRHQSEPEILVYADGSCLGNPGPGGWGVVIVGPDGTREYSGSEAQTTNNRMELTAAIEGLRRLPAGARVKLRSDSQYMIKSINFGWKRNANIDLWKDLDVEIARRRVSFEWVRGHAGDSLNERADRLALQAAKDAADAPRTPNRRAPALLQPTAQIPPPVQITPAAQISRPQQNQPRGAIPRAVEIAPAAQNSPPMPTPSPEQVQADEEATLDALRPFLRAGESIRRCAGCGSNFVAPERYTAAYCALAACQLERRNRPA
jgi:ribonuclease HI